jgi:hypothetical protein
LTVQAFCQKFDDNFAILIFDRNTVDGDQLIPGHEISLVVTAFDRQNGNSVFGGPTYQETEQFVVDVSSRHCNLTQ